MRALMIALAAFVLAACDGPPPAASDPGVTVETALPSASAAAPSAAADSPVVADAIAAAAAVKVK